MIDTKQKLILSAKKLFAEKGFDAVTVRDIASDADVAVSALNYHFKHKENLFFELCATFVEQQLTSAIEVLVDPVSKNDLRTKLELYANAHLISHLRDLSLIRIVQTEFERKNPIIMPLLAGPIKKWFDELSGFLTLAVKRELLKKDLNVVLFVSIFINQMGHALRGQGQEIWGLKLNLSDPVERRAWVKSLVSLLLDGSFEIKRKKGQ